MQKQIKFHSIVIKQIAFLGFFFFPNKLESILLVYVADFGLVLWI